MHHLDRAAEALRRTFPGCEDAPLALTLLRLLAGGRPVTTAALAGAAGRADNEVVRQLARWPNVERDGEPAVVAFSGLTLGETAHSFEVGGRLHARHSCSSPGTWSTRARSCRAAPAETACPTRTTFGEVLDLTAAFALGRAVVAPFAAASAGKECC
jgi:Helix-turn-helix domain of alkylmercury lyase